MQGCSSWSGSRGTPGGGGAIVCIRTTHTRRRALAWPVLRFQHDPLYCCPSRSVPPPMLRRIGLPNLIAEFLRRVGGRSLLIGDWNFAPTGDGRLQGNGESIEYPIVVAFFSGNVGQMQRDVTYRKLARTEYGDSNMHPTPLEQCHAQTSLRGGWSWRGAASDHRAAQARRGLSTTCGRRSINT